MKLPIVSFETAKKLKKIGFPQKYNVLNGDKYYNYLGVNGGDCSEAVKHRKSKSDEYDIISAPTLALVQMWLREKCSISIEMNSEFCINIQNRVYWSVGLYDLQNNTKTFFTDNLSLDKEFDSYDQALEVGILEAIKLI